MSFIKSYWWVFALIVGAFLIYWFVFRKPATVSTPTTLPPKLNPACPMSVQEWLSAVAAKEAYIRTVPAWMSDIQAKVTSGTYSNINIGVNTEAIWYLENTEHVCNPTKAPV